MSPLVSVVIPLYNCERFVAEAVRSALDQDYPTKEVLVVDDGSQDRSLDVLRECGDAIRIVTVANGGPARARNLGMRLARGEYIAFLDADDVWSKGKLTAQVTHLERFPETGACYTGWHVWPAGVDGRWHEVAGWDEPLGLPGAVAERSGWIYRELLFACELLTTTVMLRTEVARRVGEFDVSLPVGEDYDYWLRLSRETRVDRLDCTGALYRVVPQSASRKPYPLNYEYEVVRRAVDRFGLSDQDGRQVTLARVTNHLQELSFQHAYHHLKSGDPQVALAAFGKLLHVEPLRPRLWALWMESAMRALGTRAQAVRA